MDSQKQQVIAIMAAVSRCSMIDIQRFRLDGNGTDSPDGGYLVPQQLATDLVDVPNILRDHLFITGEFGTSLALYFDIKAVLKQRMRR